MANNRFQYLHTNGKITTLKDLIAFKNWIDPDNKTETKLISEEKLLNFGDNLYLIRDNYTVLENDENSESYIKKGTEQDNLKRGTKLQIPEGCASRSQMLIDGSQFVFPNENFEAFIADELKKLYKAPGFEQQFKRQFSGSIEKRYNFVSVILWSKSLGTNGGYIDLSPFIINLNTSTTSTGGNFNITLPAIIGEYTSAGWQIKDKTLNQIFQGQFISKGNLHKKDYSKLARSTFFFHNIIGVNDLVFISFEKLKLEKETGAQTTREDGTNKLDIITKERAKIGVGEVVESLDTQDRMYDMIALVDSNSITTSVDGVTINVQGRDLMKVLIDDNSYFYSIDFGQNKKGFFKNDNPDNFGRAWRGRYELLNVQQNEVSKIAQIKPFTIEEAISYLFTTMATVEFCPDKLFSGYTNKSYYTVWDDVKKKPVKFRGAGIWQIIKVLIDDDSVRNRVVADANLPVHSGSLLSGIQKLIQSPYMELMSDTYGDKFFFVVRRPPFDLKQVQSLTNIIDTNSNGALVIGEEDIVQENLEFYDGEVYSSYHMAPVHMSEAYQFNFVTSTFPVIYFREYNEIWGNREWYNTNIYQPFNPYKEVGAQTYNYIDNQIYNDLKYVVNSSAYLPFTRRGTIVIKGDRRIKRGVFIRHKGTGEIFYVDGVSNSYMVNEGTTERITTLQVSRGMREFNESGQYILPLYFRVISTDVNGQKPTTNAVTQNNNTIVLDIFFDINSYTLVDTTRELFNPADELDQIKRIEYRKKSELEIIKIVNKLKQNNNLTVELQGYADDPGTIEENLKLSIQRAGTINDLIRQKYKELNGVNLADDRITFIGFGNTHNQSYDIDVIGFKERAKYRRVEAKLTETNKQDTTPTYDYSGWKVRSHVFDFFIKKRQNTEYLEDYYKLLHEESPSTTPEELSYKQE
jgi:outer membrane protein OmpA-like peptidoglycan-associated protein